jgi:hypothetical protein
VIHVRLRVVPESRAWNIRREHTSVVTCVWYGETRNGAVWGNQYRNFGYYHLPYVLTGPNDAVGVVRSYIRNNDFIYLAGELDYQIFPPTGEFFPGSSFVGPDGPLPQVPQGLLTRASIGQQIQDWVKEARDALEFFNDQQAHFSALLANQLAQMQVEADLAFMQSQMQVAPVEQGWFDIALNAPYALWSFGVDQVANFHLGDWVRAGWGWADETLGLDGWGVAFGNLAGGLVDFATLPMRLPAQFLNWANGGAMPEPLQMAAGLWDRTTYRYNTMLESGSSYTEMLVVVGVLGVGDVLGTTAFGEAVTGESSAQGGLSEQERKNRWVEGSFAMGANAAGAFGSLIPKFAGVKFGGAGRSTAFKSGGDVMHRVLGPAHTNNPSEFSAWMRFASEVEAEVAFRPGSNAYSPAKGRPGRVILDPDASISAVRHEMGHLCDDMALGHPGLGYYMENPSALWGSELRQYMAEIRLARSVGARSEARSLIDLARARKSEILGN